MQNSSKFIFRQIKYLNSNNIFRYSKRYISLLEKNVLQGTSRRTHNIIVTVPKYNNFASQDVSVTSTLHRKNGISNINDLKQFMNKGKQFYLKLLTNILDSIEFATLSNEDAELLLECCGQSVADSSKSLRNDICQKVYKKLLEHNKLDLNIYHTYIKVCTENDVALNSSDFLSNLTLKPNHEIYKLLLVNVCEKGDVEQAYKLLKVMKDNGISADEEIFNKLVLGYTICDGPKAGESVLLTMRTAKVPETINTKFSMLKGVAKRGSIEEFEEVLSKYKIDITESCLLELLEILGLNGNVTWLPKMQDLYRNVTMSREFVNGLTKVCVHLVHMGKAESAITIYEEFVKPTPDKNYGFFLLKEMLHCNIDIERILAIAKHLRDENLNQFALTNLTEIALKHNYIQESWKLLENLDELRTHFFWPLIINAGEKEGKEGVFTVLKKIISMNVKIDSETLQFYVLPFYDPNDFKFLIKKLFELGLRVKEVLCPMLIILLQNNLLKQAADLCNNHEAPIFGDNFLNLLSSNWCSTKDGKSVVLLLQRYCETNSTGTDSVGEFLIKTLNVCKTTTDFNHYLELIKLIRDTRLNIGSPSANILHSVCSTSCKSFEIAEKIRDHIDGLLNFEMKSEVPHIPHPKKMKIDELECHLVELQEKRMETRGVLRKLIQLHSNSGNLQRVEELRQQFLNAGYEESIGMKSSMMHSYVKAGQLHAALNVYKEIKNSDANFKLDSFKILDLVSLLIKEDRFQEGMDIMHTETESKHIIGGHTIERNCRDLLGSFKNADEQVKMFDFLIENGYCKPTNVLLGPLVRIHLSRGDLQKAVEVYKNCADKYKCTPLQLEIICAILKSKDEVLLQNVLNITKIVHGPISTQAVLIAALAENGQEKALKKLLVNNKISFKKELEKRCERWVQEGKIEALQTLANACQRLPEVVDLNFVYTCIVRTFRLNGDVKGATEFYEKLLEQDFSIDKDLQEQLIMTSQKSREKIKSPLH